MYSRREVIDHVTVMNKDLYDNLQDGIDELKQAEREVKQDLQTLTDDTEKSLVDLGQGFSLFKEQVSQDNEAYKREVENTLDNTRQEIEQSNTVLQQNVEQSVTQLRQDVAHDMEALQQDVNDTAQGLDDLAKGVQDLERNVGTIAADASGIKFDAENDKIIVKNPYTGKWVESNINTGVIVKPSTITVSTTTLGGQAVTCTIGDETYTTTFVVTEGTSGVATFNVYSDGVATITCGEFSIEVTIDKNGGQVLAPELEEKVKLMLYENKTLKNGATWMESNASYYLYYAAETGAFKNKSLHIKTGSIGSEVDVTCQLQLYLSTTANKLVYSNSVKWSSSFSSDILFRRLRNTEYGFDLQDACSVTSFDPRNSDRLVKIRFCLLEASGSSAYNLANDTIWLE